MGADGILNILEIDEHGINELDQRFLAHILDNFSGDPAGLFYFAYFEKGSDPLRELIEPYLLEAGLMKHTPFGFEMTQKARDLSGFEKEFISFS